MHDVPEPGEDRESAAVAPGVLDRETSGRDDDGVHQQRLRLLQQDPPAATVGLESDDGEAGTDGPATETVDTTGSTTTEPGPTTTVPRGCQKQRYTVRSGDTLESIAERCDVPVDELLELNPSIDPLALNPGDKIRIRTAQAEDEQSA